MNKKVALILNNDFEEIETVTVIDLLRRASITVDTFSTNFNNKEVIGAHNIKIIADDLLDNIESSKYDSIVIPGGSGVIKTLINSTNVINLIKQFNSDNKLIAAICAAPMILGKAGILNNVKITKYPSCDDFLNQESVLDKNIVYDKNILTANAAGSSIDFALKIIEILLNNDIKNRIAKEILY